MESRMAMMSLGVRACWRFSGLMSSVVLGVCFLHALADLAVVRALGVSSPKARRLGDFDGDLESLDKVTPAEAGREAFVVDIMRVYAF